MRKEETKEPEKQFVTSEDLIKEGIEQGRLQGIAYMTAELCRWGGPDSQLVDAFRAWGCTVQDYINAGADEYDAEVLLKYQKELDRK